MIKSEEAKYEKRLALVKQINSEQLTEIKRVNERRERELEQRIYDFNIQKDKITAKAKEEARLELEREKKEFEE